MERAKILTDTQSKWLGLLIVATLAGLALLLVAGSLRYDGPEGLYLRLRAEVTSRRDHPALVPTPLVAADGPSQRALALALVSTASPTPTVAPTPDPTATPAPSVAPTLTRVSRTPREPLSRDDQDIPRFVERSTATPKATATPEPTAAPTPPPPPPADAAAGSAPPAVSLAGIRHAWQTWNNCGPATLTMALSYYGSPATQADAAKVLKPNRDDKNVSPNEMAAYARGQGFNTLLRVNGDSDRLRRLVSAGIPVLVETWLEHDGGMGHYRLVAGYDDAAGEWIVYDSYVSEGIDPKGPYPGIRIRYDEMARMWRVFNGTYLVVYDDARAQAVQEIVGADMDDTGMWQRALERAQSDVQQAPGDAFAWFNLGSSLVAQGRFADAAVAYDQARVIGLPWRMLWYQFGPFRAYYEAGRIDELIALADATIATVGNVEETFYWKGKGLQAKGDIESARQQYRRAAELNSNYSDAAAALAELGG